MCAMCLYSAKLRRSSFTFQDSFILAWVGTVLYIIAIIIGLATGKGAKHCIFEVHCCGLDYVKECYRVD